MKDQLCFGFVCQIERETKRKEKMEVDLQKITLRAVGQLVKSLETVREVKPRPILRLAYSLN